MTALPTSISFEQDRLCALERASPGSPAHIRVLIVRLDGPLNETWLRRSIEEIGGRHAALRARFPTVDGRTVLDVAPVLVLSLKVTERSDVDPSERSAVIQSEASEEHRRPFNLESGPLVRARLIRFDPEAHVLVVAAHMTAFDEPSATIFVNELAMLYRRFSTGTSAPPTQPSVRSPDSGWWQRQWLRNAGRDAHLTYWKEHLAGPLPTLQLPTDHPRPAVRALHGASVSLRLSPDLSAELDELGRRESASRTAALLAAFYLLIYRYSGQEDIVVGVPALGRGSPETTNSIGRLSYPMAARCRLAGNLTVKELLRRTFGVLTSAEEHQDIPFGVLLDELRPAPDASRHPVFQASFAVSRAQPPSQTAGLTMALMEIERDVTDMDLAMSVTLGPGASDSLVTLTYSADLFERETALRMIEHLRVLLSGMVASPEARIAELPLLTGAELQQVLVAWNDTRAEYSSDVCIHELVAEQAARAPDAIAVVFESEEMTYGELDRRSNQLAHYLRGRGVGPDVLVGLCVERAPEVVVGMLGILKAGGAFLPLDPTYPKERLTFMIDDARVPVLLSQQRVAAVLGAHGARAVLLDVGWSAIAEESDEPLVSGANARNLAYCIYTSGSTGRPKGVLLEHRGLCNLADVQRKRFVVGPATRVLQFAGLSFDASVWEIFMALRAGATLCLAPQQSLLPGPNLFQVLEEREISIVTLPPSALSVLPTEPLPALTTIIVAGEACPPDLVARWAPGRRFFNAYGPTEATVCATMAECAPSDGRPPIGRPLNNVTVYVLDRALQPVPVGVPGELHIGGVGLARGYLNRPELNDERFIPNPFVADPEARLYKTGDLVKWLSDGSIDYLGRIDHQVKVRGFRIELEEVEAVLARHPAVREIVVIVREDVPGDKRIVAYWTPQKELSVSPAELRGFLKEKLPSFMIPSAFVQLDRFPLTHNGKIDRRALPVPGKQKPEQDPYAADIRTIEGTLAQHPAVRRAVVVVRDDSIGEKRWVAHYFRRPEHEVDAAGLRSFLEAKLPGKSVPSAYVSVVTTQERLCAIEQASPANPALVHISRLQLEGVLDVKLFRRAIDEVVRRYAALRTTFPLIGDRPTRSVDPAMSLDMQVLNLGLLPEIDWEDDILRQVSEEVSRGFELGRGPLIRATLLRFARDKFVLVLAAHASIFDEPSATIFMRELVAIYESLLAGSASPFPELPRATLDYAKWQRQWLRGLKLEEHIPFWKVQLAGELPVLQLATDHTRGAARTCRAATVTREISANLAMRLEALCRREGVSLFAGLLAAFNVLLHRYTEQEDILVGTPYSGRTLSDEIDSIGGLSYPVVIRTQLGGDPPFRELLRRVADVVAAVAPHRDVPFATLLEELRLPEDEGRHPVFQAEFALREEPSAARSGGLDATLVPVEPAGTMVDIALAVHSSSRGLSAALTYSVDLFDPDTASRMLGTLEIMLSGIVDRPEAPISELPLLSAEEKRCILVDWNATVASYPRDACVHEIFEQHVARAPEAIAAVCEGTQLTYGELNDRANRLARRLRDRGVRPDVPVGIFIDRSLNTVVGLVGILKAGGAYVPLDPEHPAERLRFMLRESGAPVLLSTERGVSDLGFDGAVVDIAEASIQGAEGGGELASGAVATSIAYVMFTSGSTGRPKGVAVPHRGIVRLVVGTNYVTIKPSDRVLHCLSLAFDGSTFEIWSALLNGARVVVVSHDTVLSPKDFERQVREAGVTMMLFTTALFNQLASTIPHVFKDLAFVGVGGDALDPKWVREVLVKGEPRQFVNVYGPTENTTFSTTYEVPEVPEGATTIPIGYPVANSSAYILDRHLQPVPVGVAGELYVGGDGLARGYYNRPDLTAERFIKDPFVSDPDARIYKTGDRARYRRGGCIEFMGRVDQQVKVRGYRVELEEIEAVLDTCPLVGEAAVIVREDIPGDKRLVGYASPAGGAAPSASDLRAYLKDRVPVYMIPSAFVILDKLPLTPNGKVDRRALPEPSLSPEDAEDAFVAPRSQLEEAIAGLWVEVLGVQKVSVNAPFLDLGGYSLAAGRIMARLRDAYGVNLPVRALFQAKTVAGLATVLELARSRSKPLAPIKRASREGAIPLSFPQQQLWLLIQVEPSSPFYNETVTIHMPGALDVDALERALREIVTRHEILRTTFVAGHGKPTQVISQIADLEMKTVDLRGSAEGDRVSEAFRRVTDDAKRPFDLRVGPLFRLTLVRIADEEHILFITIHHIITDGISMNVVLLGELSSIYLAYRDGKPSPLPELAIQYADFAVWQRKTYTVEALDAQITFWDRRLAGAPLLELPMDRRRPPVQAFRGAKHRIEMDMRVVAPLKELGRREGVTLFMTLLAAFKVLLHRYTGQEEIVIGTAASGRGLPALEPLIGMFVNPLVLRTSLSGDPTFREVLHRVREVTLDAHAHQDVPFEMVVDELRVTRTRSHNPIYQVAFVLEPAPPSLPTRWTIGDRDVETGTSKADLTVHISEQPHGATVRVEYDTALFDAETIERMFEHLQILAEGVAVKPDMRISAAPLMREVEQRQILERSGGRDVFPKGACLHERLEAVAAASPDAIAVYHESGRVLYDDLNRRANQLAKYLQRLGVGPETLVGIYIDRSLELIVAILGVLKAGGAYVPLSPQEPSSRLAFMIQDARMPVILTTRGLMESLPRSGANVIAMDSARAAISAEDDSNPTSGATPDNLAYVIYSPGAAGKLRGVMATHYNVTRAFEATRSMFAFSAQDVWTMFHSFAVDFSVWEMWGALLHGGKLVVVPHTATKSPEILYDLLCTFRVTVLCIIPSAFRHVMQVEDIPEIDREAPRLRLLCFGGEVLDFQMLRPWFERHGDESPMIFNLYGLTGTSGVAACRRVVQGDAGPYVGSYIGAPIADAEIFILDQHLKPAPVGVPGEIYVGGAGLARGYWNNPELTAERFVRHPFSDKPGARLYKTRDRGRYLDNGDIEFLGRADQLMKLRGFRVEPRAIEAALIEHPDIREASVIVREDTPGDQRLVAYYVKRMQRVPTTNELRGFLKERLPDYMIPTIYVAVGAITFISDGKVDRRSLPPPDRNRPSLAPIFRMPNSAVEVLLLGIWTRLLQVDEIGVKDDFFSLGGHSLLAAQMLARVRETFRIDMRHSSFLMREFLEDPTIGGLAEAVEMVREATPSVRGRRMGTIDWETEARLDPSLRFDAPRPAATADPAAVLLTGATGFLGAFLLTELMTQTGADVYCIVRAPSADDALARIRKNLVQMSTWRDEFSARIIPVPGDLTQLLLGLTPDVFAGLASKIDIIYHNGSLVNFLYPFTALRAANVGGTREIIRLSTHGRTKPVHYVSSIAILSSYGFFGVRRAGEDIPLDHADHLFMGYPESKWVAEKMLMAASREGLPVSIYRPHDVSGHSVTGAWKTEGFLCSFLKSIIETGYAPEVNLPLDLVPVDYVSKAIVHMSLHQDPSGKVFHLNNPAYRLLPWMVELSREAGYRIQRIQHHAWIQKLVDYAAHNPKSPIAPFVPLFVERWSNEQLTLLEIYSEERIPAFDCDRTTKALAGTGITCPPVDEAMLTKYLEYFKLTGFLPPPPGK